MRCRASRISRSTSSGYATPDSAHIRGYIDDGVKPGIVLISLIGRPTVLVHEEVDPRQTLASERLERAHRHLLDLLDLHVGAHVGRHLEA